MRNIGLSTGRECFFDEQEIIVTKTDLAGRITYANDVFVRVSGFTEHELLNQPHSLIRHPDMPRCIFELMWNTLKSGEEIFAYVVNLCKNGDYYWVFAHVTPTFDASGNITSYHSNRRRPDRSAVESASQLYKQLQVEEEKYGRSIQGMKASGQILASTLAANDVQYDEYVFSLASGI